MSKITFYLDEMGKRAVVEGLKQRGYEAVLAIDLGMMEKPDDLHLQKAKELGAVVVTLDKPFAGRAMKGSDHAG